VDVPPRLSEVELLPQPTAPEHHHQNRKRQDPLFRNWALPAI
jgi:hypothetical protein